ncbi:MAG: hypothetical protein AB8H80_02350 [Planctomycetota bacterium]
MRVDGLAPAAMRVLCQSVEDSTFSFLDELTLLRESLRNGQRFRHKR